MDNAVAF